MKTVFSLFALIATIGLAHAGSFGGPPPFTNGSPLVTGVDGSYQATARGKNLTGIFRFTYANGVQTSAPQFPTGTTVSGLLTDPYNDYVFFVDGITYRGLVQANINVNSISGVFDNGGANVYNFENGTVDLSIFAMMSGYFNGSMDENSPNASFQGTGSVTVTSFKQNDDGTFSTTGTTKVGYQFRGVRAAISSSSTTTG